MNRHLVSVAKDFPSNMQLEYRQTVQTLQRELYLNQNTRIIFLSKPNEIKPFSLRVKADLDKLHFKPESIIKNI